MKKNLCILGTILIIIGILLFFNKSSFGIIGGADGPTVVFTAGILSGNVWIFPVITGILLVIVSIVKVKKKK